VAAALGARAVHWARLRVLETLLRPALELVPPVLLRWVQESRQQAPEPRSMGQTRYLAQRARVARQPVQAA